MLFLLFLSMVAESVSVQFVDIAPKIDGYIEEVWQRADSAYNFVQLMPYEKEKPSESTVVYFLQDKDNLYLGFRCYARTNKPFVQLGGNEDYVTFYLDPFGSKTTAYYFKIYVSGSYDDGWILDGGKSSDNSWDGVWERVVKVYSDYYEIEIKLPFKSIRYKKGLTEWGINFKRYITAKQETDYWTEVSQIEGNLISKYGTLKDINPQSVGYYFELFPEGFVRYDKIDTLSGIIKPSGSLNFKWDITPQITLNATTLPDFAQIESDPFTLNLSRYATYLEERRPFFIEGKEVFRMSNLGQGFYSPLNIFYSRQIGKSINNKLVPILGGLKLTSKSEIWNFGCFGAYTERLEDTLAGIEEPNRGFGVFRVKRKVFEASDIGLLFSGMAVDSNTYNYALGFDGVYRSGMNQFIIQVARSDRNEKSGYALSSGYSGFIKSFLTIASAEVVQDSFDVSDIGYVPWAGRKNFLLMSGPFKIYPKGKLSNLWIGSGIGIGQEPGDTNWSKGVTFAVNPNFRNNWGGNLFLNGGKCYEVDTDYLSRGVNLSIYGNGTKYNLNFGCSYNYCYNWMRGFLAYQGMNWCYFGYDLMSRISATLGVSSWVEFDTTNTILAITSMATPRIGFTITKDMNLGIFNELVFATPETKMAKTEQLSNRFGLLYSWNFKPKSWLYMAVNDYQAQDNTGNLALQNQIGALKVKYLIYF